MESFLQGFCSNSGLENRSPKASGRPPEGPRRPPGGSQLAPKQILSEFWCHFGIPKSLKLELEFAYEAPSWIDNLSLLEASGGGFGVDFGLPGAIGNFSEN